jgi:alcohol dehydrogenase class IV
MRSREAYWRNASALSTWPEAAIMKWMTTHGFCWRDGERVIRFGRGVAGEAVPALGGPGYLLLTTPRAAAQLPPVAEAAAGVHDVPRGAVPELAAAALAWARTAGGDGRIVALGGGRVVDVAKAVAAALGGGARAMAIPTTLSGAEMTRGHRHAEGVDEATPRVRCAAVVCDPALAASQPEPELAASALNALGHAVEAPCTVRSNPVATLAAHDAARRLVGAFRGAEPDRDELALGALLAGYTIDSTGFGLHHVLAQTLVRPGLVGHGAANAIMLPHTIPALARRFPEEHAALTAALGEDPGRAAARISALTGATRLRDLGVRVEDLDACAEAAAARPQLDETPPRAERDEVLALYQAAW